MPTLLALGGTMALLAFTYYVKAYLQPTKPYPPGPRRWPVVGSFFELPGHNPWLTYHQWKKQYGNVIYLKVFSQNIVILNSLEACVDLLQDRGAVFSDRPQLKMLELMGWDIVGTGFMRYGSRWKEHRKLLHQSFRQEAIPAYKPTVKQKVKQMLAGFLDSPKDFGMHIRNYPAAVILKIVYGHELSVRNDRFVTSTESTLGLVGSAFFAGAGSAAQLVNLVPILEYLPGFTPVKQLAQKCKRKLHEMQEMPYQFVKESMQGGNTPPSAMSGWIEMNEANSNTDAQKDVIRAAGATAFAAGTDTTTSTLESFVLAMMMYPEVMTKAQAELDRVVGRDRLPTLEDRESGRLPYIEACFRENFRFRPSNPLGLTHASTEDYTYNGQFIPKGTLCMANVWAMTHDEEIWEDPYVFDPERFMTPEGTINDSSFIATFGFGRRQCPGKDLAYITVWLGVATILSTFNIGPAKDAEGKNLPISPVYGDALVSHPMPFECTLEPRDAAARHVLETLDLE